jgi:glyoxylase-like metal-dependent hydrolase (beta-lactamase superfamily II)
MLRELRAGNPSAMTLDGTRTWLLGERQLVIIDPGPALDAHVQAIEQSAESAEIVTILLTHDHPDHAEAAAPLEARLDAQICAMVRGTLADQMEIPTDAGPLIALHTPGHTPDHFAFHWPERRAVFCGDLMMGGLDTALVAPPEGDLFDYIASLERLRAAQPEIIYPAHGDPIRDPIEAIDRYLAHRTARLYQVLHAIEAGARSMNDVAVSVYGGTVPDSLRDAARGAAKAYLDYLERSGLIRKRDDGTWQVSLS